MTDAQIIEILNNPKFILIFTILALWDLVWRGIALWKASENKSKPWFIALLVLNTMSILPLIYVFFFSNKKEEK